MASQQSAAGIPTPQPVQQVQRLGFSSFHGLTSLLCKGGMTEGCAQESGGRCRTGTHLCRRSLSEAGQEMVGTLCHVLAMQPQPDECLSLH